MLFKWMQKIRVILFSGILMLGISHAVEKDQAEVMLNEELAGGAVIPVTISFHLAQPSSQDPRYPKLIDKKGSCDLG